MRFKIAIWNGGIPPTLMKTIQTAYGKSLLIGDLDSDNKANHWVAVADRRPTAKVSMVSNVVLQYLIDTRKEDYQAAGVVFIYRTNRAEYDEWMQRLRGGGISDPLSLWLIVIPADPEGSEENGYDNDAVAFMDAIAASQRERQSETQRMLSKSIEPLTDIPSLVAKLRELEIPVDSTNTDLFKLHSSSSTTQKDVTTLSSIQRTGVTTGGDTLEFCNKMLKSIDIEAAIGHNTKGEASEAELADKLFALPHGVYTDEKMKMAFDMFNNAQSRAESEESIRRIFNVLSG